jgi:hypothetical protein
MKVYGIILLWINTYLIRLINNWFRSPSFIYLSASIFWRGLMKTTQWITQWLSWSLGRGQLIEIGRDHILGMGNLAILSPSLIEALKERKYLFLHQVRSTVENRSNTVWLTNEDLNLHEELGKEWNLFRKNLIDFGALIQDREDELIWTGGDNSGIITVKNIIFGHVVYKGNTKNQRLAEDLLEMESSNENKVFSLVSCRKQNPDLGKFNGKRMGRSFSMLLMQM